MDLTQSKLSKVEWMNAEIPVSDMEKIILKLIMDGFHNVNTKTNLNQSIFQFMKLDNTAENEAFLYKKYFEKEIQQMMEKYSTRITNFREIVIIAPTSKPPKKVDVIRIEHMDKNLETKRPEIFEFIMLDFCKTILQSMAECSQKHAFALYTLIQLKKCSIPHVNKYVIDYVDKFIRQVTEQISISSVIHQACDFIEKNPYLLKYEDMTLFNHQKRLFSLLKMTPETPKLILYIAPTGTGKTLSPIGVSEQYRVIFICVARHVGLALAKSAISVGKKIAFAFGCETASDIRLHYFAAANYSINKRSGGIGKVDNSVGNKVEIMICDVQSYLTAMHYMLAFNEETNIVTYWDEPTITMDYPQHDLHTKIHENWVNNKITKVVLSCATLPKEEEIQDTLMDFRSRFDMAEIYTIESYDCKKSISILNKDGRCMLPHMIYEFGNYDKMMETIVFCEKNKTMLRYFDLAEIIRYIEAIHRTPSIITEQYHMDSYFTSISDITMNSLKEYYLITFHHLNTKKWPHVHDFLRRTQEPKFTKPVANTLKRTQSVMMERTQKDVTITKTHSLSENPKPPTTSGSGILLTTSDAYTLTDGPTIFLADDVEKIGKFYIQSSKIPPVVFERILEKIERNNDVQKKMDIQQQLLDDKMGTNKEEKIAVNSRKEDRKEERDPEIRRLIQQLDTLRTQIHTVNLDSVYVPNSNSHQQFWTGSLENTNAFMPNIADSVVKEIMELDVENNMKILLLLGIGMFTNSPHAAYMEIMKRLAYEQKLYIIIASSDYIYGTNYAFCHGFIGKDLTNMTQQKIIQAMGRVGRNKIQQEYTVRFREDDIMMRLFLPQTENLEAVNMNRLFSSETM